MEEKDQSALEGQPTPVEPAVSEVQTLAGTDFESVSDDAPKTSTAEIDEVTTLHERTIAALSYVGFFAIVPFYLKKDSKFCRFHGKQGMLLALIFFFAKLLMVLDFVADIVRVLQFVIFLWMGFAALSGKWKKFPWFYEASCQLEKALSLESKTDEDQQ